MNNEELRIKNFFIVLQTEDLVFLCFFCFKILFCCSAYWGQHSANLINIVFKTRKIVLWKLFCVIKQPKPISSFFGFLIRNFHLCKKVSLWQRSLSFHDIGEKQKRSNRQSRFCILQRIHALWTDDKELLVQLRIKNEELRMKEEWEKAMKNEGLQTKNEWGQGGLKAV